MPANKRKQARRKQAPASAAPHPMALIARVAVVGVLLAAPLGLGGRNLSPQLLTHLAVVLATVFALLHLRKMALRPRLAAVDWALAAFIVLSAAATIPSVYKHASLVRVLVLVDGAVVFWLIRRLFPGRLALWPVGAMLAAGTLAAVIGLRQYMATVGTAIHDYGLNQVLLAFRGHGPEAVQMQVNWRVFSTFLNPNVFAGALVLILPAAALLSASLNEWRHRAAAGFGVLLLLLALGTTGSKGGLLACFAAMLATAGLGVLRRNWRVAATAGLLVLLLPGLIVLPSVRGRVSSATSSEAHSGEHRALVWRTTIRMALARPLLGWGPGTFENVYNLFAIGGFTRAGHNDYLQTAAESGIPSALALLGFLALSLRAAWRKGEQQQTQLQKALTMGLGAGVLASMLHVLVDYDWQIPGLLITLFGVAGASMAACAPAQETYDDSARSFPLWMLWTIWSLICLSAIPTVAALAADGALARGQRLATLGNISPAIEAAEQACRLDSLRAEPHLELGKLYGALARAGDGAAAQEAVQHLRQAASRMPTDPEPWFSLGRLQADIGRPALARQALTEAVKRHPHFARAYLALGDIEQAQGDEEAALAAYERVVEIEESPYERVKGVTELPDDTFVLAHLRLGKLLLSQGRKQQAASHFRATMERADEYLRKYEAMRPVLQVMGEDQSYKESAVRAAKKEAEELINAASRP